MENKVLENKELNNKIENKKQENKFYVIRESFEGSNGQKYWAYVLPGKIKERPVRVNFIPKDKGGYEPLDILFTISDKAELVISEEEMTNEITKKVSKYKTYKLVVKDEDGLEFECGVRPSKDSDKSLMQMLIMLKEKAGV